MSEDRVRDKATGFTYLFLLLFAIWMCLTSSTEWQEMFAGAIVSLVLALFLKKSYSQLGLPRLNAKRLVAFVAYLGVLLREIVKANFDVAYRILHPQMPLRPGIVAVRTSLKQEVARLMLANSITLTPGTFTMDIVGDTLLVHWISVKTDDVEESTKIIGEKFEKYLKVIFE